MADAGWLMPFGWLLVLAFALALSVPFPSGRQEPRP